MNHPIIASAYGYQYYTQLLREAELFRERKAYRISRRKIDRFGKLRKWIVDQIPQSLGKSVDTPART